MTLDDQTCGGTTSITDVTVNYTLLPPTVPSITAPASGAINVSTTPQFQLKSTDALDAYVQYKILVYQSDCTTLVRAIDQTISQVGWSGQDAQTGTAYIAGTTLAGSTLATHTYQAPGLSLNTTYCWKAAAIDPGGSNTFSAFTPTRLFTTNQAPSLPTLTLPTAAQAGVATAPEFRLVSTDPDSDYLRYKIDLCTTADCSSILTTIDQSSSQVGWKSQSQQNQTAYSSNQTGIYSYQGAALAPSTQYWWRAYAIDPAGSNISSPASAISSFVTAGSGTLQHSITGGTSIKGGTRIGN